MCTFLAIAAAVYLNKVLFCGHSTAMAVFMYATCICIIYFSKAVSGGTLSNKMGKSTLDPTICSVV